MTASPPATKRSRLFAGRAWVGGVAVLCSLWIAQVWGWFAASSCLLGVVAGVANVWAFTFLVGRLLSGTARARYGALLSVKFVGLLAVLAGLLHVGWASAFPLAMGFLAATFVAPSLVERAGSQQPGAGSFPGKNGAPCDPLSWMGTSSFPEKNAVPSTRPQQAGAPRSGFCDTLPSTAGQSIGSHSVDGN